MKMKKSAARDKTKTMESHDKQRMKMQLDFMTSDVLKERNKHLLACIHFKAWGNILFVISAIITLSQAGLAVFAQAKVDPDNEKTASNINISIALLAAFSVFWQSMIKHFDYSGNAMAFDSASSVLGKIYNIALLKALEEKANIISGTTVASGGKDETDGGGTDEEAQPEPESDLQTSTAENDAKEPGKEEDEEGDEEGGGSTTAKATTAYNDVHLSNVLTTLTKQFEQVIESCPAQVPVKIAAAFELLDNRVGVCKKKINFLRN